jgi:hypothetical protein
MLVDFFGGSMRADSPTPDDREPRLGHVRPNGTATRVGESDISIQRDTRVVKCLSLRPEPTDMDRVFLQQFLGISTMLYRKRKAHVEGRPSHLRPGTA